jgi:hypothetical protein
MYSMPERLVPLPLENNPVFSRISLSRRLECHSASQIDEHADQWLWTFEQERSSEYHMMPGRVALYR